VAYRQQPESAWDEWETETVGILETMHGTRKILKSFLKSTLVNADNIKRDENVQEIVTNTKRVLEELSIERRYGVSTPQPKHKTMAEMEEARVADKKMMEEDGLNTDSIYELNRKAKKAYDATYPIEEQINDRFVKSRHTDYDEISVQQDTETITPEMQKVVQQIKDPHTEFDDELPAIIIDGAKYPLPAYTMVHFLARIMFKYRVGEAVDWSLVEGQMAEILGRAVDERILSATRRKRLWDTAKRLNNRMRELFNDKEPLIEFRGKTIRRRY
jgi:hypothetical protein